MGLEGIEIEVPKGFFIEKSTFEGKFVYFKAKDEFKHPPLIIECKSFGARLGNPQKYAELGQEIIIVSLEKLYEPKLENIYLIRVGKSFDDEELRENLKPFLEKLC